MSSKKEKYSLEEVKQIPQVLLMRMINKMKQNLKGNKVMQEAFEEYDIDIEELEYVPMAFKDLDVSAKTDHGIIYFNYTLLCDGDFYEDYSYAVHETIHWLQQVSGTKGTKSSKDEDYLHNKYEQEGFSNQVQFIADEFSKNKAIKYVDDLLDYHDVDNKKEEKELKDIFLDGIE